MNFTLEVVCDEDSWLRHIIEGNAVRTTAPRVRTAYIVKCLREGQTSGSSASEVSGRLLSLAYDVKEYAEKCASAIGSASIKFRGVMISNVARIRHVVPALDVIADGNDDDPAHANLSIATVPMAPTDLTDAPPKISVQFVESVAELFEVYEAHQWPS